MIGLDSDWPVCGNIRIHNNHVVGCRNDANPSLWHEVSPITTIGVVYLSQPEIDPD
jgi:hypothetical protein